MKLHIERTHIEALIGQFPRLTDLREQLRFGNRVEVAFNQLQADELEALIARYWQGGVFLRAQAAQLHTLRQALASGGPIFDPDNLELLVPALARYLMTDASRGWLFSAQVTGKPVSADNPLTGKKAAGKKAAAKKAPAKKAATKKAAAKKA